MRSWTDRMCRHGCAPQAPTPSLAKSRSTTLALAEEPSAWSPTASSRQHCLQWPLSAACERSAGPQVLVFEPRTRLLQVSVEARQREGAYSSIWCAARTALLARSDTSVLDAVCRAQKVQWG